jgi:MinD superfamily P-loop ATPase
MERTYGGIPREKIPWHPTILAEMCTKCGACVSFCHQAVYVVDDGPAVKNPFNCIVGCTGYASECLSRAFIFPSLVELRDALARLRKEDGVVRGGHP